MLLWVPAFAGTSGGMMTLEDDIGFFTQVPSLAALGPQALRVLAIGAESRHLPSGAVLFYAGELADGGYIVQEGSLAVEPGSPAEGREFTAGPGTLLGELALLTDTVSPVTAIAKEPTTVIRISRNLFRKMLEGYPAAAQRLRDMMAERLGTLAQDLEGVQRKLGRDDEH
jgi:CRP-like cAMP-binding protein